MKLTQWFPGDVKPVHVGVYERRLKFKTDIYYSRWDGEKWGSLRPNVRAERPQTAEQQPE